MSLAPGITEILYEIGLEKSIVGVSSYCNYLLEVKNKVKVGDLSHPVLEKILSLKPDIVFAAGIEQKDITEKLKIYGVKVEIVNPSNIQQLFKDIKRIGCVTGKSEEALILIRKIKRKLNKIKTGFVLIPKANRPKIFILLWHDPLLTAGKNSFVGSLIEAAGGVNSAGKLIYPYSRYSVEKLIEAKPDYILICAMDEININYVKKIAQMCGSEIIDNLNPDLMLRPGPRIADGVEIIYGKLYGKE